MRALQTHPMVATSGAGLLSIKRKSAGCGNWIGRANKRRYSCNAMSTVITNSSKTSTEEQTTPSEIDQTKSAHRQELLDAGKAKRQSMPRYAHGTWKAAVGRPDPLSILRAADAARLPELVPIRYGRMLQSPFTFYRGSAAVMASDLSETPTIGLKVQACGDCHLMNFGGFATPERNIIFDINDFDETLPAPWEWDVKRLAASFVLAARSNGLADDEAKDIAVQCIRSYRKGMRQFAQLGCLQLWYTRFDGASFLDELDDPKVRAAIARRIEKQVQKNTSSVAYPKLAENRFGQIRIKDAPPLIFHPQGTDTAEFRNLAGDVLSRYRETLPEDRRILFDRYRFVDAAIKVVGIGSVGTRCWIALLISAADDPLFLQLKQAGPSVLEPYAGKSAYSHNGQRVVIGQRLMQAASDIFLGWTTGPAGDFYVRQLRDAKISPAVETFDAPLFASYATVCGRNLARAHAKSGDAWTIAGYLGKSDEFDEAVGEFAMAYADQAERDHAALKEAVRRGDIEVYLER